MLFDSVPRYPVFVTPDTESADAFRRTPPTAEARAA
jgi:hypothetical protein